MSFAIINFSIAKETLRQLIRYPSLFNIRILRIIVVASAANLLAAADPPGCIYGAYYYNKATNPFEGNYNIVLEDYVLEGGGVSG